ncbi:hypothetical protein ACFFP0_27305 [Rhizobium puerariae]|uniref:Uncharacterized protein n=1 Tax=Rhizobium puerariae TaxID=1585791 RepID=A0ABV6AR25_9HYPH
MAEVTKEMLYEEMLKLDERLPYLRNSSMSLCGGAIGGPTSRIQPVVICETK